MRKFLFIAMLAVAPLGGQASTEVKVISRGGANAQYAIGLLKQALARSDKDYQVRVENGALSGMRLKEELVDGSIDVIWTATNREIEQQAIPVRIPLYKGLLGWRLLLVHEENLHRFRRAEDLADLRGSTFCQGVGYK